VEVDMNDIYGEIDKIKREISEFESKDSTGFYGEGETIRNSSQTEADKAKLDKLHARLKELTNMDDESIRKG
jgi:hypothetical protein